MSQKEMSSSVYEVVMPNQAAIHITVLVATATRYVVLPDQTTCVHYGRYCLGRCNLCEVRITPWAGLLEWQQFSETGFTAKDREAMPDLCTKTLNHASSHGIGHNCCRVCTGHGI